MHQYYGDIIEKLGKPKWFDENAVPRYCCFSPDEIANIYAQECVLYVIACQGCGKKFLVCSSFDGGWGKPSTHISIRELIETNCLHYGDPPNICCCGAGPSMNCEDLKVIQFWEKPNHMDWVRNSDYEIYLDPVYAEHESKEE